MNRNFDESKHIKALRDLLDRRQQEQAALRDKVRELQDQKAAEEQILQDALNNSDNEAYLAAHRNLQSYDMQLKALQDLLAHKEKISNKPEVIAALNNAIADFEAERKKERKKYQEAKRALAQLYVDACHAENVLKKTLSFYMNQEMISDWTGEVKKISSIEPKYQEAARFFRDDLIDMGYDFTAIMTAQSEF